MATQANSRPVRPLIVRRPDNNQENKVFLMVFLAAGLVSVIFHAFLIGALFMFPSVSIGGPPLEVVPDVTVQEEPAEKEKVNDDPFLTTEIDPAGTAPQQDIQFKSERTADNSVPGMVNPVESVGITDGDKNAPPMNLPAPGGFGNIGQGGAITSALMEGTSTAPGEAGGYGLMSKLAGSFYGRSGATREMALINGGGTKESEAAVSAGLQWLAKNQAADGRWVLDGAFRDRGEPNDIAGTAFGLLPFLGAGKTHKSSKNNPYDKPIEKALLFLIRKQNKRTGDFGGGMYAHGLATIAICEAYGLTQDPGLRRYAQMAVNFIVRAQHSGGGWRYSPGQAGDMSVTGWQVMALKSAQMAGLDVPETTMRRAQLFLNSCCNDKSQGYGYIGPNPTPTMSAVGLLCRQYLQAWGPQKLELIRGIDNHIKPTPPGAIKNMYYYYYATQVLHHFGGAAWKTWNEKMRDNLVKAQVRRNGPDFGSWSSAGDAHGTAGGRLMITSLSLLTLEVYYRHLPLYYREAGGRMASK
jgi:hypothetical protein